MKYLLELYQEGGCDYTIGCGYASHEFECNVYGLREKVKEIIDEYSRDQISTATLYQVSHKEEINIDELFAIDDAAEEQRLKNIKEAEEKRLLAELKAKYPDS
jgi:hypothetical protein